MKRYGIVGGLSVTAEKVAAILSAWSIYLPSNYKVIWSGTYHGDNVVVIEGIDDHGWTMDRYIIPRLGSEMMHCTEIDLSHPVMKEIPEEK